MIVVCFYQSVSEIVRLLCTQMIMVSISDGISFRKYIKYTRVLAQS